MANTTGYDLLEPSRPTSSSVSRVDNATENTIYVFDPTTNLRNFLLTGSTSDGDNVAINGLSNSFRVQTKGNTITLKGIKNTESQGVQVRISMDKTGGTDKLWFADGSVDVTYSTTSGWTIGGKSIGKKADLSKLEYSVNEAQTFAAAEAAADTGLAPTTGQVFALTEGTDNFNPTSDVAGSRTTSGNDLFRAAGGELSSSDVLNGGAGDDTLNAAAIAVGQTIMPLLTSIEVINFTAIGGSGSIDQDITLDLADSTGVEQVWLKDADANTNGEDTDVFFDNIGSGVIVGIDGGDGANVDLTIGLVDAATNTADALTIALKDASIGDVIVSEIETVTLSNSNTKTTTSSSIAALSGDKLKTLNIDGSGTLTVTALSGTGATLTKLNIAGSGDNTITTAIGTQTKLTNIDGTAANGDNTVIITGGALDNSTIKMGAGDDTVGFDTTADVKKAIGTEGKVDGGTGKNTLRVSETALDTTDATNISKALNFQVLENAKSVSTADTSLSLDSAAFTGISEFLFSGTVIGKSAVTGASAAAASAGLTVTNVENNDLFVFVGDVTGGAAAAGSTVGAGAKGMTFAAKLDNGSNVLSISLKASASVDTDIVTIRGASGITGDTSGKMAVDASNFETVNLSSTGDNADNASWGNANALVGGNTTTGGTPGEAIAVGTNAKLVITGNKHLDLSTGVTGQNAVIDASAFTGILKVATLGDTSNNTLIGGSQADELNGGKGVDIYTGNGGNDKFIIGDGDAGTTGAENITDFALGADVLDLTSTKTNIADLLTATSVVTAISGAVGGDTLLATVSKGIISLSGNAVAKVDTVAELVDIFKLLDSATAAEIGAVVMNGNTYVLFETSGGDILADVVQLVGVTNATAIDTVAATGVITIA